MTLVDIVYPRVCPVCREIVRPDFCLETDTEKIPPGLGMERLICPHCYNKVPFIKWPTCMKCGTQLEKWTDEYCSRCKNTSRDFVRNLALMDYANPRAGQMMWDFKYSNKREYADFFALELTRHFGRQILDFNCEVIIPVPVHRSRKRERGYNQAEVLARRLGELLELSVDEKALLRVKRTLPQKKLDANARYQNLRNAFLPGKSAGMYRRVLLVDDIYTTGTTMQVCARTLMEAGVERVYGLTCCAGRDA